MKSLTFFVLSIMFSGLAFTQTKPNMNDSNVTYADFIYTDEINGCNVFTSDSLNRLIQQKISQNKYEIDDHNGYPRVYFVNKMGDKYLEIWGGPDLGYGWFYAIGYTEKSRCVDCGTYLGKSDISNFVINNGVALGDDIKKVSNKMRLNYFRRFKFKGIEYFYFERGVKHEVPFTPDKIFYYKFKKGKLIEIGLGYGIIGVNPMLQPE